MLKVFIVIGDGGEFYHELIDHGYPDANEKALWTEQLESHKSSSAVKLPQKNVYMPAENVIIASTYLMKFISFCNFMFAQMLK